MSYPKVYILFVKRSMDKEVRGVFASWNDAERKMREMLETTRNLKMRTPYDESLKVIFDRELPNGRHSRGFVLETGEHIGSAMTCTIETWTVDGTPLEILAEAAE